MSDVCPKVSVILVNYNNWRETLECIGSLSKMDYPDYEVVVVDNGSTDDSVPRIKGACPQATMIEATDNLGFSGGCNLGVHVALRQSADFIWLLNNDTVVRRDALTRLIQVATQHPTHAFFGSWICFNNHKERLWYGGGVYVPILGYFAHALYERDYRTDSRHGTSYETPWVTGCSLLVRANRLSEIGLLDESFFIYREEQEWQLRLNPLKPRAVILAEPLVFHNVGGTTGSTRSFLGTVFSSRNYLKLALLHAGLALPCWLLTWFVTYLIVPLLRRDPKSLRASILSLSLVRRPPQHVLATANWH